MGMRTRIKNARKKNKLTQAELADKVGVHEVTVRTWENTDKGPNSTTMINLATALNTTVAYLTGETDDPQPRQEPGVNVTTNGNNSTAIGVGGSRNTISVPSESENVQRDSSALEKDLLAKSIYHNHAILIKFTLKYRILKIAL